MTTQLAEKFDQKSENYCKKLEKMKFCILLNHKMTETKNRLQYFVFDNEQNFI